MKATLNNLFFRTLLIASVSALVLPASSASASSIAITEWMYSNVAGPGEYFEITNIGTTPIDLTGWSQDDSTRTAGMHPLDSLGILQPGESAIGTQGDPAAFRAYWGLSESVKVLNYGDSDSLGRSDEINIYDTTGTLIDQLTFNDQGTNPHKGPRTQGTSGNIPLDVLLTNTASSAVLSVAGDEFLSYRGGGGSGDLGNPGIYTPYQVPEPSSIVLCLMGMAGLASFHMFKHH